MNKHTDEQIVAEYRQMMNSLARELDYMFNKGKRGDQRETGFVLLVFPFGDADSGRINYISNGERSDIVTALKEIVARFEGQGRNDRARMTEDDARKKWCPMTRTGLTAGMAVNRHIADAPECEHHSGAPCGQQLVARIKRSSKYYYQTDPPGKWFDVRVVADTYYQLRGNNNNYRFSDVVMGIRIDDEIMDFKTGKISR